MSSLTQSWQAWAAKFAALKPRERQLIAGAVVFAVIFGGYALWIEPALLQGKAVDKQLTQQRGELASLQAQVEALRLRTNDPDAANRAMLAEVKKQLAEQEAALRKYDGTLVPPDQVSHMLESLLARHQGLELVSLKTLPAAPLTQVKKETKAELKPDLKPVEAATVVPPAGQIYRHGIELKLAGNFNELLAYVTELEKAKQRPLWSGMEFNVTRHPRAELTLTLYTLSMDSTWLLM